VHQVYYWSSAFNAQRRMHVYTPPGYEAKDSKRYPVLYIRHGAGDNDSSWMTAGRANYILDNLIAARKAVPMIIVSTADSGGPEQPKGGITQPPAAPAVAPAAGPGAVQSPLPTGVGPATPSGLYGRDLFEVVIPYIDKNYRTIANARNRAMAGLSAGGSATLNNGLPNPQMFQWIGVYSMGVNPETYLARNKAALEKGRATNQLVYYAVGKEDGITANGSGAATNKMLSELGYRNYVFNESTGGHTWINWRRYLNDFAPRLFK
jgi:enterochelin esterase family protein